MKITQLHIENYKSIKDLVIENPNPFSVFVGPNGAGKSNIFDALEFANYYGKTSGLKTESLFGGANSLLNYNATNLEQEIQIDTEIGVLYKMNLSYTRRENGIVLDMGILNRPEADYLKHLGTVKDEKFKALEAQDDQWGKRFFRIFLNNVSLKKINVDDDSALSLDGSNIEKVLNRILQDQHKHGEIIEWLQVLVPEFKDIQIDTSKLSGDVNYVIYEKHTNKPFPKHLISDGTKNILSLLTAVYQSDEPQFLCIEEPENGLHPHVIRELVSLFRNACKEKGHYIWLNTHSETLVRQLTADEIIVVDKKGGATNVRQNQGKDFFGLKMDEAWLTNALGGGLP